LLSAAPCSQNLLRQPSTGASTSGARESVAALLTEASSARQGAHLSASCLREVWDYQARFFLALDTVVILDGGERHVASDNGLDQAAVEVLSLRLAVSEAVDATNIERPPGGLRKGSHSVLARVLARADLPSAGSIVSGHCSTAATFNNDISRMPSAIPYAPITSHRDHRGWSAARPLTRDGSQSATRVAPLQAWHGALAVVRAPEVGRIVIWSSIVDKLQRRLYDPSTSWVTVARYHPLLESSLLLLTRFLRTIISSSQLSYDALLKQTSCSVLASVPAVTSGSVAALDAAADAPSPVHLT
jgi:hypothetical protein